MKRLLFTVCLLTHVLSCEDADSPRALAVVNGKEFLPDKVAIVENGTGLQLQLAGASESIRLWLTQKESGTYAIFNTSPANNPVVLLPQEPGFSVVEYVNAAGKLFYGVSGSITINVGQRYAKGSFSFEAESAEGEEVTVVRGEFFQSLSKPDFYGCAVATIARLGNGLVTLNSFGYDSDGNINMIVKQESLEQAWSPEHARYVFLSYAGGKITAITEVALSVTGNSVYREYSFVTYRDDKIESIRKGPGLEATFDYNDQGLLTSVTYTIGFSASIAYDANGNFVSPSLPLYDNKRNYATSLLASLQNQQALTVFFSDLFYAFPSPGSRNNPLRVGDFELAYEYNAAGYPTSVRYVNAPGSLANFELTYFGCQ